METYRGILLVLNWIGAIALIIVGIGAIGLGVIIGSAILGMIGHFLINVVLAIPFILLNNGDILESMKGNTETSFSSVSLFIPSHRVKLLTNVDGLGLRKKPNPSSDPYTKIPNGIEVQHLNTGDEVSLNNIKGFWYEIITKERIKGWCFSGSLEKI
jgi:hypothetical protein